MLTIKRGAQNLEYCPKECILGDTEDFKNLKVTWHQLVTVKMTCFWLKSFPSDRITRSCRVTSQRSSGGNSSTIKGSPKWIFTLRLAILDRLATKERLARWGVVATDLLCPFCNQVTESLNHLFFQCCVSGAIWKKLLSWQGIHRNCLSRQEEITWAVKCCGVNSKGAAVYRIVLDADVYQLWIERNAVFFSKGKKIPRCHNQVDHSEGFIQA